MVVLACQSLKAYIRVMQVVKKASCLLAFIARIFRLGIKDISLNLFFALGIVHSFGFHAKENKILGMVALFYEEGLRSTMPVFNRV